jgi:hypothetical protein
MILVLLLPFFPLNMRLQLLLMQPRAIEQGAHVYALALSLVYRLHNPTTDWRCWCWWFWFCWWW